MLIKINIEETELDTEQFWGWVYNRQYKWE